MAETIVALDMGTTHLRAIEALVKKGSLPKVIKIHSVPLELGILANGMIRQEEALAEALKRLWAEGKFKAKKVVAMATGEAYDNREMNDVPWSPPADFKRMLPYYVKERLPYDADEYYFDSHTLGEYYKDKANDHQLYKRILVTGVSREYTDAYIRAVESAGLIPVGLDILPLALIRANSVNSDAPANAVIVSIDLGGDITTMVVHQNNQPQYTNTATPLGGLRITEEIAKSLGISVPEAEMIKTSFSMNEEQKRTLSSAIYFNDGSTRQTNFIDIKPEIIEEAQTIIAREVTNLISHIGDILEDAFAERRENPFEIVLTGRGAELATLVDRIQTELGVPVRILQPFNQKQVPAEVAQHQNGYSGIYGLLVGRNDE